MWEKNIWQQLITLPEPKKNESKKEGLPDSAAFAAHWAQLGTPFVVCNSLHRFSKSPGAGGKHMSPQSIEGYRAGRDSAAKRHASWQIHLSTALLTASHTQMLLWQRSASVPRNLKKRVLCSKSFEMQGFTTRPWHGSGRFRHDKAQAFSTLMIR